MEKARAQVWFSSLVGRRSLRAATSSASRMPDSVSSSGRLSGSASQKEFLLARTAPIWRRSGGVGWGGVGTLISVPEVSFMVSMVSLEKPWPSPGKPSTPYFSE